MGYKFLLELFKDIDLNNPIGTRSNIDNTKFIYELDLYRPQGSTYFTQWGGRYNNPESFRVSITYSVVLSEQTSLANMLATMNSYFIDTANSKLYFQLPKYNHLYPLDEVDLTVSEFHLYAVKDEDNPLDPFIVDSGKNNQYTSRLMKPNFNSSIGDVINGIFLQQKFNISLINAGGLFDSQDIDIYFNRKAILYKTDVNNPTFSDFNKILEGEIEEVTVNFDTINFKIADKYRQLDNEVCRIADSTTYPSIPTDNENKKIPIAYGLNYDVDVFQVGTNQYLCIDGNYLTNVADLRDSTGASLLIANYGVNYTTGLITVTGGGLIPVKADITGINVANTVGAVITNEIASKANIPYNSTNWNLTDTNNYITSNNNQFSLVFDGDTLKELIAEVLKNDMVYLITQNDGKFVIKDYAPTAYSHTTHILESWQIGNFPTKKYKDNKFWCSKVLLKYANGQYLSEIYDPLAVKLYKKSRLKTYECGIANSTIALFLANKIAKRFYKKREIITVKLNYDTYSIQLLDNVTLSFIINDRVFSPFTSWKVIEIDPANDIVTLEEI